MALNSKNENNDLNTKTGNDGSKRLNFGVE